MKKRCVGIHGDIDEESIREPLNRLIELWVESRTLPIVVEIDSKGGYAEPACKVYQVIQPMRRLVHANVVGRCESAATLILLACSVRRAYVRTHLSIHSPWLDPDSFAARYVRDNATPRQIEQINADNRYWCDKYMRLYADGFGRSLAWVKALFNHGDPSMEHLRAYDALRIGVLTEVVSNPITRVLS